MNHISAALRVSYPKALSALIRIVGSLDEAEDLLQEAAAKALVNWATSGVPQNPKAWLVQTARNRAIDQYRRRALEREHALSNHLASPTIHPDEDLGELQLRDDLLRLIFTCCHPILSREAQVALTLKAVGGLTVEEIAKAFLIPARTMEQRITRAKRRLRDNRVPYEVPSDKELPGRLSSVLAVVQLIFNEGYSASVDAPILRHELCRMAIGQSHLLHRLFPGDAEVEGILALHLLCHARSPARVGEDGSSLSLDRQNRNLWDRQAINEGLALLDSALRRGYPGPYQVQAAISATHCKASCWEDTDWPEIVCLYDALLKLTPSPVVELNRAVAVSQTLGPEAGLSLLLPLESNRAIAERHYLYAVRGALCEELELWEDAKIAYQSALERTVNPSERRYFQQKVREVELSLQCYVVAGHRSSSLV